MAIARTHSATLVGVTGHPVEVEADLSAGLPGLTFTGLPDTTVVEARDRVRAAIVNSGAPWPNRRITVALLPADVRKAGSIFDVALAVAVLAAAGTVPSAPLGSAAWIGELGLDGQVRAVRGVLPAVLALARAGITRIVVPAANAAEAALVPGLDVRAASHLCDIVAWLRGEGEAPPQAERGPEAPKGSVADLGDVLGQVVPRRALEVAAAGAHHVFLRGSPGSGKTMLAERLPGILPALDDDQALEVTGIHSVSGRLPAGGPLLRVPPFQAPHHTASVAALVGGGSGLARAGAISLAHRGVLFLDEAPEFAPMVLDALRQPLESGRVVLHRSGGAVTYPARFLLVLAANPCPCAAARDRDCSCPSLARRRYQHRLSGPLRDRVDISVTVDQVARADLMAGDARGESSDLVAARVVTARRAAAERWAGHGWATNAEAAGSVLRSRPWRPSRAALVDVEAAIDSGRLSARGYDRVLRLAWTVADLTGVTVPGPGEVGEALYYRLDSSVPVAA
ncbi:MAG: YifB family Mg chelatase-like AAA ATPase [bacterium]